jgi:signal transduction histidine kinase
MAPTETAARVVLTALRDDRPRARPPLRAGTLVVGAGALAVGAVAGLATARATAAPLGPGRWITLVLVVAWCLAAALVAREYPLAPLGGLLLFGGWTIAVSMVGAAELARAASSDLAALLRAAGLALMPAVALHLVLALPDGRLADRAARVVTAVGYLAAVVVAAMTYADRPDLPEAPLVAVWGVALVVGVGGFVGRCRRARSLNERARFQWLAWAVVVASATTGGAAALHALVSWPESVDVVAVGSTGLVPAALALGAIQQSALRIDRILVHTITLAGLAVLVGASYVLVVLGLGRAPRGDEETILGLSMLAALLAALLWVPTRARLGEMATRRVYGERHAPDDVIRTFGSRLTRALPLDELLLQLAESLKATMGLESAEVWTRTGSRLERAVSMPERGAASIALGPEEEVVVARAGVSGPAWAKVWLPALVATGGDPVLRIAPVTNSGELLGIIVVRRPDGAHPFGDADDLALTDLARQVGLALHNVKLDSALQESLDEVRRQADALRASRARIVEATDSERRRIERDLHDGAQQHLVALAVSVRLARQLADADVVQAKEMLDQIAGDLQEAVQELRNLAHGIYPPLLMDRGLSDALRAAATRAALPTDVVTGDLGRYPQAVEAAVYFCCLEALQNAGKHAGDGAAVKISLYEDQGALFFQIEDDGAGFDLAGDAQHGHGFVNMSDRVGAFGGTVNVRSTPGSGTTIAGRIPLP